MPTTSIKEVARHAGVSVGAVSNVLNRPDHVPPATSRLEQLIARGTPVVLVGRGSGRLHRRSVAVDPVLGGRLADEPYDVERAMRAHLLAARERHLPFFEGP